MKKKVLRERRAKDVAVLEQVADEIVTEIVLGTERPEIKPYDGNEVFGVIEEAKPTKKRASKKKEA
jgi:hypothetical protein